MIYKINDEVEVVPKTGEISRPDIVKLVQTYKDNFYANQPSQSQTAYAWFDIGKITTFINDNPGATGIRLYYGSYPIDTRLAVPAAYKENHTVIFVCTKRTQGDNGLYFEEEMLDPGNYILVAAGLDFATLCPPGGNHKELTQPGDSTPSVAYEVYSI